MATAKASSSANKRKKTTKAAKAKTTRKRTSAAPKHKPPAKPKLSGGLLTKSLGLEGWERLEPVILASLASEEPLLLVGRHGAAKSFLLERLAEALGLEFRFYNASLVNFDDLVGFPVPEEDKRSLRYIGTPTAIWDAEVVFLDEINRTRPELQNKLFPIVHERRVQGVKLDKLRYRWAAMNPPPNEDDDGEAYLGAEPLDPALADRFAFLLPAPEWGELGKEEKRRILGDQFGGRHEFKVKPQALVAETRRVYVGLQANPPDGLADYLIRLETSLSQAGLYLSTRRVSNLHRNVLAVQAARIVLREAGAGEKDASEVGWEESALTSLLHSLPQAAGEKGVNRSKVVAAHRQAWEWAKLNDDDPWKAILGVSDPIERLAVASGLGDKLSDMDVGKVILEAVSSQEKGPLRMVVSLVAYLRFHRDRNVPGTVVETLGKEIGRVLVPFQGESKVRGNGSNFQQVAAQLSNAGKMTNPVKRVRLSYLRNLLYGLLPDGYGGHTPKEVRKYFENLWRKLNLDEAGLEEGAVVEGEAR